MKETKDKLSVMNPEPGRNVIALGNKTYEIKALAFGPLKRAKAVFVGAISTLLERITALEKANVAPDNVGAIVGQLGDVIDIVGDELPAVIRAFVPAVDPDVFESEDGATIPQILDAVPVIVKANGFDRLPNLFRQALTLKR